ncbi:MAG: ribonuclease H-like domain-containing protein [Phycisphaerae bacterium]
MGEGDENIRKKLRELTESIGRGLRVGGEDLPSPQRGPFADAADELRRKLRKRRQRRSIDKHAGGTEKAPSRRTDSDARSQTHGGPGAIVYKRDLPETVGGRSRSVFVPGGEPVVLEEATCGQMTAAPDGGAAWVIEQVVDDMEDAGDLCARFRAAMDTPSPTLTGLLDPLHGGRPFRCEDAVFFDLETTGLSSSPLFLIGAMVWEGGSLVVKQYFARNYAEERAVLSLFRCLCQGRRLWVSFNGKSFDWPYVRTRSAATGVAPPQELAHLDLLHVARRVWKPAGLPNCKLQTLERAICNRLRFGDIPGNQIPDAYHAYVHSGNAVAMVDVLKHNLLDLVTLADLIARLPRGEE